MVIFVAETVGRVEDEEQQVKFEEVMILVQ
jgi:hypothetical protein